MSALDLHDNNCSSTLGVCRLGEQLGQMQQLQASLAHGAPDATCSSLTPALLLGQKDNSQHTDGQAQWGYRQN